MTIQELKEHCQQQCRKFSILAEYYEHFSYEENKAYQEHKLVLQLIERLQQYEKALNRTVATDTHTCPACKLTFPESESYKWHINNRLIDCCPNCKQPIMYAKENKYDN